MPELDKVITFSGLHILLIVLISNIISDLFNDKNSFEYITNLINYAFSLEKIQFWFFIINIVALYIFLVCLKIEFGFRASISFNF